MIVTMDGEYETRDGQTVKVLTTEIRAQRNVAALIDGAVHFFHSNGRYLIAPTQSRLDLMVRPLRVKSSIESTTVSYTVHNNELTSVTLPRLTPHWRLVTKEVVCRTVHYTKEDAIQAAKYSPYCVGILELVQIANRIISATIVEDWKSND